MDQEYALQGEFIQCNGGSVMTALNMSCIIALEMGEDEQNENVNVSGYLGIERMDSEWTMMISMNDTALFPWTQTHF